MATMRQVWAGDAGSAPGLIGLAEALERVRAEYDWPGCLPARAAGWRWRLGRRVKRAIDVLLSGLLLAILSPLLVTIAVLVKLTSRGPVLFRWHAMGAQARPFVTYKFRTMVADADRLKGELLHLNEMRGPVFKIRRDPRITALGRHMRKYSLDELPQLWSVLKGDMSLVGPRPPFPEELAQFDRWQWAKLAVTPGITCIWQVSGRSEISDFGEWARLDLEYIANWSVWLDLKILLRTIPAVIGARGAY